MHGNEPARNLRFWSRRFKMGKNIYGSGLLKSIFKLTGGQKSIFANKFDDKFDDAAIRCIEYDLLRKAKQEIGEDKFS